jgi:APA family basic amino acid/polyamine antiporter
MSERPTQEEGLIRVIGTTALSLNIVNMVVGAGIFVLPGIVAARLGPGAFVAYLICSAVIALIFLCYAEIGSRVTRSGGSYAYVEEAFGPFAGFIASMLLWFGWCIFSDAAIAAAMFEMIAASAPLPSGPLPRAIFLISALAFMAAINIIGAKAGARLSSLTAVVKLVPLLLLLVVGIFAIEPELISVTQWPSLRSVGASALVLFFAFAGAEGSLSVGGEIREPARTVPWALLLALGGILLLYVGLQTVAQGVLGPQLADNTAAPLAAAAERVLGTWGSGMLTLAAIISIFATLTADVLCTPRVLFAAARNGNLPKFLSKVHPRFKTPYVAISAYATGICLIALSGSFELLAVVASGSILLVYLGVSLAVLRLRQRDGSPEAGLFRLPGGPVIPVLSSILVVWLLFQLEKRDAIGLVALVLGSVVVYAARGLARRNRPDAARRS